MLSNAQYSDHCMVELLKEHSTIGVNYSQPLSAQAYSYSILKTLQCCWYKFFAASVCIGTASKKN